jgi:uncharacterized protein YbcI
MSIDSTAPARRATAVGTAITRLHREHYGRGATTTRTLVQRNCIVVLLEDLYTPVERTLIEAGNEDTVKETRQKFQVAMGPAFSAAVEEIMERKVIAFMSQVHFAPDLAAEIFVLEPNAAEQTAAP